LTVT